MEQFRLTLSTGFMWIGARIAPHKLRPVLINVINSWSGIPEQQHQGRTGGLIMTPWFVNVEGERLARNQLKECSETALRVRERFAKEENS